MKEMTKENTRKNKIENNKEATSPIKVKGLESGVKGLVAIGSFFLFFNANLALADAPTIAPHPLQPLTLNLIEGIKSLNGIDQKLSEPLAKSQSADLRASIVTSIKKSIVMPITISQKKLEDLGHKFVVAAGASPWESCTVGTTPSMNEFQEEIFSFRTGRLEKLENLITQMRSQSRTIWRLLENPEIKNNLSQPEFADIENQIPSCRVYGFNFLEEKTQEYRLCISNFSNYFSTSGLKPVLNSNEEAVWSASELLAKFNTNEISKLNSDQRLKAFEALGKMMEHAVEGASSCLRPEFKTLILNEFRRLQPARR